MVMLYCAHYRGYCACTMHHYHVSMNRLGINKCLSQAAQEVKPEASSLDNP